MFSDETEYSQQALSDFLHNAILSVWERMIAGDTEFRAVDRKRSDDEVSNCALLIVSIYL